MPPEMDTPISGLAIHCLFVAVKNNTNTGIRCDATARVGRFEAVIQSMCGDCTAK